MKYLTFALDSESDYAGCINRYGILKNQDEIKKILDSLLLHILKLTVFVTGEILKRYFAIVELFKNYNCESEIHSYSQIKVSTNLEYKML